MWNTKRESVDMDGSALRGAPPGGERGAGQGGVSPANRGRSSLRRGLAGLALGALALPFAGASGCADTLDGGGHEETVGADEPVGEARQAATPVTCVTLRGGLTKTHDTFVSSEKVANNYGTSTVALIGAASGGLDQFVSLFKFDVSMIPVEATLTSAIVSLSQTSTGVGTWNAHLITAPWSELTVTWASFGGAFAPGVFKSGSTANPTVTVNVLPQAQGWVSGAIPNHGFALEQLGPNQTKIKTRDFPVIGLRPTLVACYQLLCPPGFADCNGLAADGCEADLNAPTSCGACGNACSAPHASASCTAGVCGLGVCDPGFGDCDADAQNGCETSLTTTTDCGGCGVACALPGGVSSCASGGCKVLGCSAGAFDCDGDLANGCEAAPCADGSHCDEGAGCASQVCVSGLCASPTCNDHTKNGDETGVDCGGACALPEVCNGVDDDCDGVVDNGCDCVNGATQACYTGAAVTAGVGACHAGTQACVLGHWGACAGEHTPGAEVCNGVDDDCDGQTDEDLGSTICGVGACQVMVQNCVAGAPTICSPQAPVAEVCDGVDNDCNGQVDEGLPSLSCGVGACATTAPSCVNGAPGVCDAHAKDGSSCNDGHDCTGNDACQNGVCTGSNLPAGTSCRASAGACDLAESCTGAAPDCPADAKVLGGTVCRAAAGVCDVAESCNGVSSDCPGDGFTAAGTTLGACVTGLSGVCSAGTSTCPGNAASASCVQNLASSSEVCDGLDNDCNGQVDERGSTVLWHRFDDSASPVSDASGNGNTGILSGPTYAVPTPDGSAKALSFAAGNTYNVNSLANFNFGSQLTVQLWIKWVGQSGSYRGVVGNGYFNTGGFEIRFGRESSGTRLGLRVNTVNGAAAGDLYLSTNVWHHVAMVYNGASLVGYLDGVQGFSTPLTGAIKVVGNVLRVGNNVGGVSEPYAGLIDDLRIDTAALLPGQLALSCH